jgi:hypothetical protein
MVVAAVLLSATIAYAGDLKPAPNGGNDGNSVLPIPPVGSKDTGMDQRDENANDNAAFKSGDEDKDKIRKLRPVK